MKKAMMLIVAGVMALSVAAAAPPALASGSSVTKTGRCGTRPWSLVLAHDNGRIEADYKLGNVKVGRTWRVVMKDNGVRFAAGNKTTQADGSFSVTKFAPNQTGTDHILARASNLTTGEVCRATAAI